MSLAEILDAAHRIDRVSQVDETEELRLPPLAEQPTVIMTSWSYPAARPWPARRPHSHRRRTLWRTRALVLVGVVCLLAGLALERAL